MPIFIIAEIGINHNGDIKLAKNLIDMAVDAGADAVKFQKGHSTLLPQIFKGPRKPLGYTTQEQKEPRIWS